MVHLEKKGAKIWFTGKGKDLYLLIYNSIKEGGKLPPLSVHNGLTKTRLNWYVSRLKKAKIIRKVGYGTYEINKTSTSLSVYLGVAQGGSDKDLYLPYEMKGCKSDFVRAHNLVFKIKVGKPPLSWEARLSSRNINYSILSNGVARVLFNGFKLWFIKDKVIVYFPPTIDFKAPSVASSLRLAINRFFALVNEIEALIGFSLRSNNSLVWALDRKHLSLVKNALAEDYNFKKEKLIVSDVVGPWLIADYSKELNELEAIRSPTNTREAQIVQAFFNDLKNNPMTLSDLTGVLAVQMGLHKELTEAFIKLKEKVDNL